MSYDLAVFDPRSELREREIFERWYDERSEWEDGLNYNEPSNATPRLQAWFHELRQTFVPMNGPLSPKESEATGAERFADYTISTDLVYVAFSWSAAEEAHALCKELAQKHGVGFLDASSFDGAAWFPTKGGGIELVHTAPESDE
jgi:hypothetical protein